MRTLAAILMLTAALGCSTDHAAPPTPRPYAYHRPAPADTTTTLWQQGADSWIYNTEATAMSPRAGWLTVAYPKRHLNIYITYTRARGDELAAARSNRMERLLLNSGSGSATEQEYINAQGWQIYLLKSQNTTTPLQFLATDGVSTLVSGSLQSTAEAVDYEAIRPDVERVTRDIFTSLGRLGINDKN